MYEDDSDGLWMGCSHGPVAGTLCEVSSRSGFAKERGSDGLSLSLLIPPIENNYVEAHTRRQIPIVCR